MEVQGRQVQPRNSAERKFELCNFEARPPIAGSEPITITALGQVQRIRPVLVSAPVGG